MNHFNKERSSRPGVVTTAIGEIPEEWEVERIDKICDILDKRRIPLNKETRKGMKGDIPYYGANGLLDYVNDYIFDDKLILMAEDGGHFGEYAFRPIAYMVEGKCWVNNHAHVLKVLEDQGFLTEYVLYSLEHRNIIPWIVGSTRGKLNQKDLRSIPVPVPSFSEQKKIASVLSTVDDAIQKTDEIIAKSRQIKKGLMQQLLTKGIRHTRFKESPLGEIPEEWEVLQIRQLVETKVTDGPHETPRFLGEGVDFLSADSIVNNRFDLNRRRGYISRDLHKQYCRKCRPQQLDIFLCKSGSTTGKTAIVDFDLEFSVWSPLALIRAKKGMMDPYFVFYSIQSDYVQKQIRRTWSMGTQPNISMGDIERLRIICPPLPEQRRIASILSNVDDKSKREEEYKAELERVKRGLMQVLLTGKIRVKVNT